MIWFLTAGIAFLGWVAYQNHLMHEIMLDVLEDRDKKIEKLATVVVSAMERIKALEPGNE